MGSKKMKIATICLVSHQLYPYLYMHEHFPLSAHRVVYNLDMSMSGPETDRVHL